MGEPFLEVRNLCVHFDVYEGSAEVINGVDFTIEEGETVALVGESGCGKSVTMLALLGLLPAAARVVDGEIRFKGDDLLSKSEAEFQRIRGREIGMILQDPMTSLNPVFTVGQQMLDVLKWQGTRRVGVADWVRDKFASHDDLRERAIEMLEAVQISAPERVLSSYPAELSGGMRQRVLIAIALLSEPDLLIADEPGTALDVTTEDRILELLADLVDETGASVLYVSHDLGVVKEISDRINVMYAGEIVERASTDELYARPQHPYTRGLLDSVPKLASGVGEGIEGSVPDYTDPPEACRFYDRCRYAAPECSESFPYPRESRPGHDVACHLHDGPPVHDRHVPLADRGVDIGSPPWERGTAESPDGGESR